MRCAWQALIKLLPLWMRDSVDRLAKASLQELRMRLHAPPELVTENGSVWLDRLVSAEDLCFTVNVATRYSPWAATSASAGFITASGGHRIGLCGQALSDSGFIKDIHKLTSLCIRVARDFPGISEGADDFKSSVLIVGCPGSGKTTLLRDLIRQRSNAVKKCIAVVDEREEIFPKSSDQFCFPTGRHTDVLSGCKKKAGIESLIRSMGPQVIAVDEITVKEDSDALLHAGWCGVKLIATAHAGNIDELYSRPVYRPILDSKLFDYFIIMNPDKTWRREVSH